MRKTILRNIIIESHQTRDKEEAFRSSQSRWEKNVAHIGAKENETTLRHSPGKKTAKLRRWLQGKKWWSKTYYIKSENTDIFGHTSVKEFITCNVYNKNTLKKFFRQKKSDIWSNANLSKGEAWDFFLNLSVGKAWDFFFYLTWLFK